jgi:uncharacterized SAM-dependent methyltransferase
MEQQDSEQDEEDNNSPQSDFEEAALEFLAGAPVNMGAYLYGQPRDAVDPVRGAELYRRVLAENKDYYVSSEEAELLQAKAADIAQIISGSKFLMDLGPGLPEAVRQKTVPLLNKIEGLKSYIPVDVNKDYLETARQVVQERLPGLPVSPIHADFIRAPYVSAMRRAAILFTGSTLANLLPEDAGRLLWKLNFIIKRQGYLLVGQDENQEEPSLMRAYDHPLGGEFIRNVFCRIRRDLDLRHFDPAAFAYRPEWRPESYTFAHVCVSLKAQEFEAGSRKIRIAEGQKFQATHSFKYPREHFQGYMLKYGFELVQRFAHEKGRMALYVFQHGQERA